MGLPSQDDNWRDDDDEADFDDAFDEDDEDWDEEESDQGVIVHRHKVVTVPTGHSRRGRGTEVEA